MWLCPISRISFAAGPMDRLIWAMACRRLPFADASSVVLHSSEANLSRVAVRPGDSAKMARRADAFRPSASRSGQFA